MSAYTRRSPLESAMGRVSRSLFSIVLITLLLGACISDSALQQARDDFAKNTQELTSLRARLTTLDANTTLHTQSLAEQATHLSQVSTTLNTLTSKTDTIPTLQHHISSIDSAIDSLRNRSTAQDNALSTLRNDLKSAQLQQTTALHEHSTANDTTFSTVRNDLKSAKLQQADLAVAIERTSTGLRTLTGRTDDTIHAGQELRTGLTELTDTVRRLELATKQASLVGKEAKTSSQQLAVSTQSALQSMSEQINHAIDWLQATAKHTPEKPTQSLSNTVPATTKSTSEKPAQPAATKKTPDKLSRSTPSPAPAPSLPAHTLPPSSPPEPTSPGGEQKSRHPEQPAKTISPGAPDLRNTTYHQAITAIKEQRYTDAVHLLTTYLSTSSPSPHTPAALLNLGLALQALQSPNAHEPLTTLVATYPNTHEAAAAQQLLQSR